MTSFIGTSIVPVFDSLVTAFMPQDHEPWESIDGCPNRMMALTPSGTVTVNDTLDLLAEHMGVGEEVADLTKKVTRPETPRQSYPAR